MPNQRGLTPQYYHRHFSDDEKRDRLVKVVAPVGHAGVTDSREGNGPAPIQSELAMYATIASAGTRLEHAFTPDTKRAYVHLITSSYRSPRESPAPATVELAVAGQQLSLAEGDGAFIEGSLAGTQLTVGNVGSRDAELLVFSLFA